MELKALQNVADRLKGCGFACWVEGGGAVPPFVWLETSDGQVLLFGNEDWAGEIYVSARYVEEGAPPAATFELRGIEADDFWNVMLAIDRLATRLINKGVGVPFADLSDREIEVH